MFKPLVYRKPAAKKLTHNEKAVARVIEALNAGRILKAFNALAHEDTTVGPYQEAVDRGVRFAVMGYARQGRVTTEDLRVRTVEDAAWGFVNRVGSTRAREAAI